MTENTPLGQDAHGMGILPHVWGKMPRMIDFIFCIFFHILCML